MPAKQLFNKGEMRTVDEKVGIVRMVSGKTADGIQVYAYISVKPSLYEEFDQKVAAGEKMNMESYGKILHKGFGKEPSEDVKQFMQDQFGIDHHYGEQVAQAIDALVKEATAKK